VAIAKGKGAILDLPLATPECPDAPWHYVTQAMWHGRPVPLTLRFDWHAWGGLAGIARRMDAAFHGPECATELPALVREGRFATIVLHEDARCRVLPAVRECLTEAFGPGESTWEVPR
jgi:hypothetical protein